MTKLTATFSNSANAPKNQSVNAVKGADRFGSAAHTKHTNTLCGQNVGLLNVKPSGTYIDLWASNDKLGTPLRSNQSTQPSGRGTVGPSIKRLLTDNERSSLYKIIRIIDIIIIIIIIIIINF